MWQFLRPKEALEQLGLRLKDERIAQALTQQQLAQLAGVSSSSVWRIEASGMGKTDTLLRILTALNIADRLDALLPEATPSPMVMLAQRSKQKPRRRVRHRQKK